MLQNYLLEILIRQLQVNLKKHLLSLLGKCLSHHLHLLFNNNENGDNARKKKRNFQPNAATYEFGSSINETEVSKPSNTAKPATSSFNFSAQNPPSTNFGSTSMQAPSASSQPSFAFGSTSTSSTNPVIVAPTTPATSFKFNTSSTPSIPVPSTSSAPSFTFGSTQAATPTINKTPSSSFGAPAPSAPAVNSLAFGQQPQQLQPSFNFGGAAPATATPQQATAFNFGSNNNMQTSTPAPQFGATAMPSTGGFGMSNTPASTGFTRSFGQSSGGMMAPQGGGFSIGTGGGGKSVKSVTAGRRRIKARRPPSLK